jgi:hypothetical protein
MQSGDADVEGRYPLELGEVEKIPKQSLQKIVNSTIVIIKY